MIIQSVSGYSDCGTFREIGGAAEGCDALVEFLLDVIKAIGGFLDLLVDEGERGPGLRGLLLDGGVGCTFSDLFVVEPCELEGADVVADIGNDGVALVCQCRAEVGIRPELLDGVVEPEDFRCLVHKVN